jgi:hypothetical protein
MPANHIAQIVVERQEQAQGILVAALGMLVAQYCYALAG